MNSEVNNNIKEVNWKYFPNTYQLSLYLARNDLIQLSLTCKCLRLKLKSKFTSKLVLMKEGIIIPSKPNKSSKSKQLISLSEILEEDYLDRYNIVNHCVIWGSFNKGFAKNFFNLFTNITRLELYSGYIENYYNYFYTDENFGSNTVLIEALYPLKRLESLIMASELINNLRYSSSLALKLPLCLKNLTLIESKLNQRHLKFYPIEIINEKYSNLNKVSIINDRMLSNMLTRMKSLKDVTIFSHRDFTRSNQIEFLLLSPQLESLTIPAYFLEHDLVNPILQMKQLRQLNIKYFHYWIPGDISFFQVNTSIEHLNIDTNIGYDVLLPFLNNLKSLKVLKFSDISLFDIVYIDFSECTNRIPLLHLNNLKHGKDGICSFENLKIFDSIRFTKVFELDYYLANYERDELENWDVCHLDLENSEDFTLINKT
jgi:hypothetical protein